MSPGVMRASLESIACDSRPPQVNRDSDPFQATSPCIVMQDPRNRLAQLFNAAFPVPSASNFLGFRCMHN